MEALKMIPSCDGLKDFIALKIPSREVITGYFNDRTVATSLGIGIGVCALSAYTYLKLYKYRYWKSRGVKGPQPTIIFGNLIDLTTKPVSVVHEWQEKYGSVYGVYAMWAPMLVICDAEIVKEVVYDPNFLHRPAIEGHPVIEESLINKNDDEWRHDRSVMSPSFSSGKMKLMYPLMIKCIECLNSEFEKLAINSVEFNPKDPFIKLTTMVIARCAFGTEVNSFEEGEKHPLIKHLYRIVTPDILRFLVFIFTPSFLRKKLQLHASHPQSFNYIIDLLKSIIKTRKEQNVSHEYSDLLQLLLDTQKEEHGLSDDKIIANSFLFFIAGLETTSQTLTFISYCLAMNPDVQDQLYQELKSAIDEFGSINYDSLHELHYLDAVINETLRLYSPAPQIARICKKEHTLKNGIKLDANTIILIGIDSIHRNPLYHPDPEVFNPSRFMPENKGQMVHYSFLPFVAGTRHCIGMRFALLQLKLTVVEMILKYKFVKGPNTPEKVPFKLFSVRTETIKIKVEKRE